MGILLDIVDKVVPRVMKRMEHEGIGLKEILEEELEKEVGQTNKIEKEPDTTKNTLPEPSDR